MGDWFSPTPPPFDFTLCLISSIEYAYDAGSMITNKTQMIGAVVVSTDYVYDSIGHYLFKTRCFKLLMNVDLVSLVP